MGQNHSISFYTGFNPSYNNVQKDMFGRKMRGASAGPASILTGTFDPIEQKRAIAQKRAYKVVSKAYAGDKKIDDDIEDRKGKIKYYETMYGEANSKLAEIDKRLAALQKEYEVDPDSQEQKDLDILKQYQREPYEMSKEDFERAFELDKQGYSKGYTEYQKRALEIDMAKDPHLDKRKEALKGIIEENGTIRGISRERLKYHTMIDANNQSEEILENASKEIMGMLIDEAVDHVDEKSEEEIKKAEESKEEKKEEEEKLEEARERREEMEALADPEKAEKEHKRTENESDTIYGEVLTEAMLKMDGIRTDIQQEVSDIATKMKLVAEDLKGIKVDELV